MISGSDYKFLSIHNNVKKICEIGTGTGKSTRALSSNGAIVYTMDQNNHNPIFKEKVHHYNIHSRDFWLKYDIKDFNLYFREFFFKTLVVLSCPHAARTSSPLLLRIKDI